MRISLKNIRDVLIVQMYFIKNKQYFPECINSDEIITRLEKCIDLINKSLPKDVDCFGKEGVISLKDDEWNTFDEVYKKLRRIYSSIITKARVKDVAEIEHQFNELCVLIVNIEKRLLAIVN